LLRRSRFAYDTGPGVHTLALSAEENRCTASCGQRRVTFENSHTE